MGGRIDSPTAGCPDLADHGAKHYQDPILLGSLVWILKLPDPQTSEVLLTPTDIPNANSQAQGGSGKVGVGLQVPAASLTLLVLAWQPPLPSVPSKPGLLRTLPAIPVPLSSPPHWPQGLSPELGQDQKHKVRFLKPPPSTSRQGVAVLGEPHPHSGASLPWLRRSYLSGV